MKKSKRILALLGVILLVGMYLATLIFALMENENASDLLMASILCTIAVPVLLYGYILLCRVFNHKNDNDPDA